MIVELFLDFFLKSPLFVVIDKLDVSGLVLNVDMSVLDTFLNVVRSVLYFFPVRLIYPIFGFIIILQAFRLLIAFLRVLAQLIPLW